jgi:hypothetical protein
MARIYGNALQGGADAFVIASFATALEGQTELAYQVKQVGYEVILPATGQFPATGVAAAQDLEIALLRRTKAAMPNYDDSDIIKKWKWGALGATAAGWPTTFESAGVWVPPLEVLVVEDPLYIALDSTATTLTYEVIVYIEYDVVRISQIDRLTLLTQSLS